MTRLITLFSLFLIFFGLHTGIAIAPGGKLLMPYVLCFVGAVIILIVTIGRFKFRVAGLYGCLTVVLTVFAVITARADGNLGQHLISTGQLLYALMIGYTAFIGLKVLGLKRASQFFLVATIILIVGSFLEVYGNLKPVSDAFRASVNGWQSRSVYSNDLRDELDYGGIRPKLFSSEPAALGRSVGYAALLWFLSARRLSGFRFTGLVVLTLLAFVLVRSPTILICFVVAGVCFLSELGRRRAASSLRMKVLSISVLVGMLVIPGVVSSIAEYGQSASFFQREVGPPLVTALVLRSQPLLGTGIGGWGQMLPYGQTVFSRAGGASQTQLLKIAFKNPEGGKHLLNSETWEFWIDLGLLGGIIVLWILWLALKVLGVSDRFMVLSCSAFLFTMTGGLVLPGGWLGLFSLACLYQMHAEALAEGKGPVASEPHPNDIVSTLPLPGFAN